jgi:cellulose synthase/poly-beta-1,6-N-acetylglucosamine synthase-like glycosyltransferase
MAMTSKPTHAAGSDGASIHSPTASARRDEGAVAPKGFERTKLELEGRRGMVIIGLAVLAFVIFVSFAFSYHVIFELYAAFNILIMTYYLVLWLDGAQTMRKPQSEWKEWPSVSVIIPSYNSHHTIQKCIECCKKMGAQYAGKFEIIVVDDGSRDGSVELLKKIEGVRLILKAKNAGKGAAVNEGIRAAKGEIIACLDSDTYPDADVLAKCVSHFNADHKVGGVVLYINTTQPHSLLERVQELEYWVAYGLFFQTVDWVDSIFVTPGPMALYRKKMFDQIGLFDEKNIAEDMEIALRMHRHGWKIRSRTDAVVRTEVPSTIKSFYKQRLRWYRGGVMNILNNADLMFNPKYNNLSMLILPTVLASGLFSALFVAWSLINLAQGGWGSLGPWLFHFWTVAPSGVLINPPDIFLIDSALLIALAPVLIWVYFLSIGFKMAGQKLQLKHILPALLLLLVYPITIGVIFFIVYIYELTGQKYTW